MAAAKTTPFRQSAHRFHFTSAHFAILLLSVWLRGRHQQDYQMQIAGRRVYGVRTLRCAGFHFINGKNLLNVVWSIYSNASCHIGLVEFEQTTQSLSASHLSSPLSWLAQHRKSSRLSLPWWFRSP